MRSSVRVGLILPVEPTDPEPIAMLKFAGSSVEILDICRRRKADGNGFESLRITKCSGFTEEVVRGLRASVGEVTWDEYTW